MQHDWVEKMEHSCDDQLRKKEEKSSNVHLMRKRVQEEEEEMEVVHPNHSHYFVLFEYYLLSFLEIDLDL